MEARARRGQKKSSEEANQVIQVPFQIQAAQSQTIFSDNYFWHTFNWPFSEVILLIGIIFYKKMTFSIYGMHKFLTNIVLMYAFLFYICSFSFIMRYTILWLAFFYVKEVSQVKN